MASQNKNLRPLGELISFPNSEGLTVDGILFSAEHNDVTVVHLHGSLGNFYSHKFVRVFAGVALRENMNLLSINMSGHDGLAEGYFQDDRLPYVGGSVVEFEKCLPDIAGAVDFASSLTHRIILQGHSLGCDRILHFLNSTGRKFDCVLLAPCDSYQLQSRWLAPETVESQLQRLEDATASDTTELMWLPLKEYGIRQGPNWTYPIPISGRALLSIIKGPPFRLMRIDEPAQWHIASSAFVHVGGSDALQCGPPEVMFDYLESRFSSVEKLFMREADHMMAGYEVEVANKIAQWIRSEPFVSR